MRRFDAIGFGVLPLSFLLTACSGLGATSAGDGGCQVPSVYLRFYAGLVQPTWETEATMRRQIPGRHKHATICWYGLVDGRVEGRVNTSAASYTTYTFVRKNDEWVFEGTRDEIIVN